MPDIRQSFKLESAGALTVGANKDRWIAPFPGEIVNVSAVVGTAPTGAALIIDILKDGTTVFSTNTKPTIAISAVETASAFAPDSDRVDFAAGDVLSLSVTQIGSTVAGSDLDVVVQYLST